METLSKMMRTTRLLVHPPPQYYKTLRPLSTFRGYNQVRGGVPAGSARPEEEGDLGRLIMDLSAIGIPTNAETFALRVEGHSMIGAGINDGDTIILERREPAEGDIVAALVDNQVTLKRYVLKDGKPILRPENPAFADIIPLERLEVQGVAVGLIRRL